MVSIFGSLFLHFEDPVNKGQIFNFYRHFIYENFINKKYRDLWDLQHESVI